MDNQDIKPLECSRNSAPQIKLSALSPGAELFVWSVRTWVRAARQRQCVVRLLVGRYHEIGCVAALPLIDEIMMLISAAAYRPVCIHFCNSETLSGDEHILVRVLQAIQRGQDAKAQVELSGMIGGRLNFTFRRAAGDYVEQLAAVDLHCTGIRALSLVKT